MILRSLPQTPHARTRTSFAPTSSDRSVAVEVTARSCVFTNPAGAGLIFVDGARSPEYLPWSDVERVDFDRPPAMYPPFGGR